VIAADTKKKGLVGEFNNGGRAWARTGEPVQLNTHDFASHAKGKATPYGVYDVGLNEGYMSVGISADMAALAASSILARWQYLGRSRYPDAEILTITADSGGFHSPRGRQWRFELGELADLIGIPIRVLHYPPGTSKRNRFEHRLFSYISINWRGKLKVYARLDESEYPTKVKVTNAELADIEIERHAFHGDWNDIVYPHHQT
jgi:hypothetical protein